MTSLLLDTNAYSALQRGHPVVRARVQSASLVLISSIVIGELLAGFSKGTQERKNRRILDDFLASPFFKTVDVSHTTAERFAIIWLSLRRKGHPIPTNDMWIAAQAMETGAQLISFDHHFEAIDGLFWFQPDL